jgi:ATP-dependent Clp protease ATP-binding subunit ClpA
MPAWEPFQERLRQAIILAQEEVKRLGGGSVGTEHLLLGIVAEHDGPSAQLLREWGVGIVEARNAAASLGLHPGTPSHTGELAFTVNAKRLIERCFDVAREAGQNFVGTEHMLVAMTRQKAGGAHTVLENVLGPRLPSFVEAASQAVIKEIDVPRPLLTSVPAPTDAESRLYAACLHAAIAGGDADVEELTERAKRLYDAATVAILTSRSPLQ